MYKYFLSLLLLIPGFAPVSSQTTLRVDDAEAAVAALEEKGIGASVVTSPRVVPEITLVCPEKVLAGQRLVDIIIVKPPTLPDDLLELSYSYTIELNNVETNNIYPYEKSDGQKGITFASPDEPGMIEITFDVNWVFGKKATVSGKEYNEKFETVFPKPKTYNIVVVGSDPTPPTPNPNPVPPAPKPPGPTPNPSPVFPNTVFGMDKVAYDAAMTQVSSPYLPRATVLANNYETVANRINISMSKKAAGVPLTGEDIALDSQAIMNEIKNLNRAALGESLEQWQGWNKVYGDAFYNLAINKRLADYADWAAVFQETATGLRAVYENKGYDYGK